MEHSSSSVTTDSTETFYLALIKFILRSKGELTNIAGDLGLSSMQLMTLLLTDNTAPHSMNRFCKLYDCDASNVTGIIDGLEQKGLAERSDHPSDRRIKIIRLLPKGERAKSNAIELLTSGSDSLFRALSPKETIMFTRLVTKLATSEASQTTTTTN